MSVVIYKYVIAQLLKDKLKGKFWEIGADLGCGEGLYAPVFRQHVKYLIGVDVDEKSLRYAEKSGYYDELIHANLCLVAECPACAFMIKPAQVYFLIEVIEHLPRRCGENLLNFLRGKSVYLTTPAKFHSNILGEIFYGKWHRHRSFWSIEDLRKFNFKNFIRFKGLFAEGIFAWK